MTNGNSKTQVVTANYSTVVSCNHLELHGVNKALTIWMLKLDSLKILSMFQWVIARKTCSILPHTLHADMFFGHKFCVLAPNDSKFIGWVLMTIIHVL